LPKDLQDQLNGDVNWTSPYGTFPDDPNADPGKEGAEPKGEEPKQQPKGLGSKKFLGPQGMADMPGAGGMFDPQGQGGNLKAPNYPPTNPMALVRFVDVDVVPGAQYQYRIAVRLANPNYKLSTKLVANAGWTKNKEYASDWVETPRISIPEEYFYYVINQTKGFASRIQPNPNKNMNMTIDYTSARDALGAERIPFQFHKYVGNFQTPDALMRYVADWEVAERVLVGKGETLGREVELEIVAWNWGKGQFEYAGTSPKPGKAKGAFSGVPVDFRPPQPIILLDYVGGEVKYTPKTGAAILDRECAVEALLLMPDGTMIVRNSRHDMDDRGYDNKDVDLGGHRLGIERRQRYEEWRTRHEDFRNNAQKMFNPAETPGAGKGKGSIN
jgi:hypothetical protein